jgi:hypothetical protein
VIISSTRGSQDYFFARPQVAAPGGYCCKRLFVRRSSDSPTRRCSDRIMLWGTTSLSAKLTGDSGIVFEALLIGDCRPFRCSAENQPLCLLGLLQQYRHKADIAIVPKNGRSWRKQTSCPALHGTSFLGDYGPTGDADMIYLAEQFPDPANFLPCSSEIFPC